MGGVERELAMEALAVAAQKLPLKVKIIEASEI
jgi:large subunit ribosomal protein L16